MKNRILSLTLLFIFIFGLSGGVRAQAPILGDETALIYVEINGPPDIERFEATGLPAYARLRGNQPQDYLLSGADAAGQTLLSQVGLTYRVLDANMRAASYHLVYAMPGRQINWGDYGLILLDDGVQVLLRTTPQGAEDLAQAGAQLQAVTFDPKPLHPVSPPLNLPAVIDPDPLIQTMIDQVDSNTVYDYTGGLTGDWPVWVDGDWYTINTRHTNSGEPIQKAAHWAGEHLTNLGLGVEYHVWDDDTNPNVIGELPGLVNPDDIFIIGGHLDDVNGTPGADDNASGSVAALIAADILTQYQWGCTLRFALWTGEEQGLWGSHYYAERSSQMGENIVGYLNLDMISYNTVASPPDIDLLYNPNMPLTQGLAQLFADVVSSYNLNLIPQLVTSLGGGSDHSSFWQYGYTAILGIEDQGDFNPNYHDPGDTLANQNLPYYTEFVKASVGTLAHMTNCLISSGIGNLDGTVTDASDGDPIEGAAITMNDSAGHTFVTTTDVSGYYTRTLLQDTYTVTASAFGYLPDTVTDVVIITDTTTTQDFALQPALSHLVEGYVTDINTGWPLYASITINGSPLDPIWTDPLTGYYSIVLPEGIAYTFDVDAWVPGYLPESRSVGPLTTNLQEDFQLDADPIACIAPGYLSTWDYYEDFEAGFDDWSMSGLWNAENQADTCGSQVAPFPSPSNAAYYGQDGVCTFNTGATNSGSLSMLNPVSLAAGNPVLRFASFEETECGGNCSWDNRYVEISTNGGSTWSPIYDSGNEGSWNWVTLDLSPYAGQDALFRFRFDSVDNIANSYFGWMVDSIGIGTPSCDPQPGGLIVGNVYDTNTMTGLVGAEVSSDEGGLTFTTAMPDDPNVDDGFYTLFASPGTHVITATYTGFDPLSADVNVINGDTVLQHFYLGGYYGVQVTPPTAAQSGNPGSILTYTLTVSNTGSLVDSFDVALGVHAWTTSAPATIGPIQPGESADLDIYVTIPVDAADGESDTVTVTVSSQSDSNQSNSAVVVSTAVVPCAQVTGVDFTWSPMEAKAGEEITFTATASGTAPISYAWDFDDDGTGAGEQVLHTYTASGVYTVSLTASNACGEGSTSHAVTVSPVLQVYLPIISSTNP